MMRGCQFVLGAMVSSAAALPIALDAQDAAREQRLAETREQIAELEARIATGEATLMDCGVLGMRRAMVLQLETPEGITGEQRSAARRRALAEWRDREPPDACAQLVWANTLSVNEGLNYLASQASRFEDNPLFLEVRATALWNAGRMNQAIELIGQFLRRNPESGRALELKAAHASRMGDERARQAAVEQIFANDPGDVRAAEQWFTARAQGLDSGSLRNLGRDLLDRHLYSARSSSLCRKVAGLEIEGAREIGIECFDRVLALDLTPAEREEALVGRGVVVVARDAERFHELAVGLSPAGRRRVATRAMSTFLSAHRCDEAAELFEARITDDLGGRDVAGFAAYCSWNPRERALAASLVPRLEGDALVAALDSWPNQVDPRPLLELLLDALSRDRDSSTLRLAAHTFLAEHGTTEQQLAHFEDWVQVQPIEAWRRKEFIRDLYWSGETEAATRLAGQYFDRLATLPDQSSTDYSAGMLAVELGMVKQASTYLERLRAQGGRESDLARLASRVALLQQDLPLAADHLRQSMFLDGAGGDSTALYGEVLWHLGEGDRLAPELEALYDRLAETPDRKPSGSKTSWVAGKLLRSGYYARAADYLESIDAEELTAAQRQDLVRAQRAAGNVGAAIAAARLALEKAPADHSRRGELIRMLLAAERYPEAIAVIEESQSRYPDHPSAQFRYALGEALLESGEAERAVEVLTRLARESNSRGVDRLLDRALVAAGLQQTRLDRTRSTAIYARASQRAPEPAAASVVARADRLMAGSNGAIDLASAVKMLHAAADGGDSLARLRMLTLDAFGLHALTDESRSRYAAIDIEFVRAMAVDSPTAQSVLGTAYLAGAGPLAEDPLRAREYFQMAVSSAPWAGHNLAWMHETGVGGPVDIPRARKLYAEAAALGNARSMESLARLHLTLDSDVDLERVEQLLESATRRSHAVAAYHLGRLLITGEHGMPVDTTRGLAYLESAAKQGLDEARQLLIRAYSDLLQRALKSANVYAAQTVALAMGKTDPVVHAQMTQRVDRLVAEGDIEAQAFQVYAAADIGRTMSASLPDAVAESLRQAAGSGSKLAMYFLAEHLVRSVDAQSEAIEWWERAATAGHRESQHQLGWRYVTGAAVTKNLNRGFRLLETSADLGYLRAIVFLARCYDRGDCGVPVNEARAMNWYRLAADQGEAGAIGWLRGRE